MKRFEELKAEFIATPVLAYANFSLPFILEVDASHSGLRVILTDAPDGQVWLIIYS